MASDNLRSAPAFLTPPVADRLVTFMDGPLKAAPRISAGLTPAHAAIARATAALHAAIEHHHPYAYRPRIGVDVAADRDQCVTATISVTADGAHKILCLENTPGATGTARKAPSAVSSGTATRRTAQAPLATGRENGCDTRSPAQPVADNKATGGEQRLLAKNLDWITRRFEMTGAAIAFLKARGILVTTADRDAQVRQYYVTGKRHRYFVEDVIELAQGMGWEFGA